MITLFLGLAVGYIWAKHGHKVTEFLNNFTK